MTETWRRRKPLYFRRPPRQFVSMVGDGLPDLRELLRGRLKPSGLPSLNAVCIATGTERVIDESELLALSRLPFDRWLTLADARRLGVPRSVVSSLVRKRLLITRDNGAASRDLRQRHRLLAATRWHPYAALYHYMSKWKDAQRSGGGSEDLDGFSRDVASDLQRQLATQPPPPPHFYSHPAARGSMRLPLVRKRGGLYDALRRRTTHRLFDTDEQLELRDLATILYYAYGCHGSYRISDKLTVIKKTSPSGGSMHSIEVYPLLLRVRGLATGLYHYRASDHAIELLQRSSLEQGRSWAYEFTAGQPLARDAHALFILTARFPRTFWKYPEHAKAYRVVLMDAAHLSQTLYLVLSDLGLGGFFTTAISDANIEARLKINGFDQGAIGISAFGVVDHTPAVKPFRHRPYRLARGRP